MITRDRMTVIGGHTQDLAYGLDHGMPWPRGTLPDDMGNFRVETKKAPEGKQNLILVYWKTFEAMGAHHSRAASSQESQIDTKACKFFQVVR